MISYPSLTQFYLVSHLLNIFISNGKATKTISITKIVIAINSAKKEFKPIATNLGFKNGGMLKIKGTMAIQVTITIFHFLGF